IALEASQQARRTHLPIVREAVRFEEVLQRSGTHRYALDEEPHGIPLGSAFPASRDKEDEVALLVGPEGGWTDAERAAFLAAGWTRVSMGPLILRAETAAIAALAVVRNAWLIH